MKKQTLMKYCIIAAFVVALITAYPLSQASAKQIDHIQRVTHHISVKPVAQVSVKPASVTPVSKTVTPVTLPAPVQPAVQGGSCARYISIFDQYNWNVRTAVAICQAESQGVANAVSSPALNYDGISDYGLMQLHGVDITDPAANISYAYYHKYLTQGWGAWSTYNSGKYQQYL